MSYEFVVSDEIAAGDLVHEAFGAKTVVDPKATSSSAAPRWTTRRA